MVKNLIFIAILFFFAQRAWGMKAGQPQHPRVSTTRELVRREPSLPGSWRPTHPSLAKKKRPADLVAGFEELPIDEEEDDDAKENRGDDDSGKFMGQATQGPVFAMPQPRMAAEPAEDDGGWGSNQAAWDGGIGLPLLSDARPSFSGAAKSPQRQKGCEKIDAWACQLLRTLSSATSLDFAGIDLALDLVDGGSLQEEDRSRVVAQALRALGALDGLVELKIYLERAGFKLNSDVVPADQVVVCALAELLLSGRLLASIAAQQLIALAFMGNVGRGSLGSSRADRDGLASTLVRIVARLRAGKERLQAALEAWGAGDGSSRGENPFAPWGR